ncbi:MAG: undecaprenyl-diphosphate phosphatase [Actinomycetota bacterium]|nr:undecaprenyl-diphosphate phosphatase [Actinomycetota bacterium]
MVAFFLLLTAALLFSSELWGKYRLQKLEARTADDKQAEQQLTLAKSLIIGVGQALAIMPGISRSGATISFGRYLGLSRKKSVRFSFLLSVPVIFGSFLFQIIKIRQIISGNEPGAALNLGLGFIFSFLAGLFAIKFMLRLVENRSLNVFAIYCVCLSVLIFVFYFINM